MIPFFQGFLLGAATKKPLFLGVRNKVCAMCHFYKSKGQEVKDHECFLNFSGPSTAMEQSVIVEGFINSVEQHGLIYKYYIGISVLSYFILECLINGK